jgi:hypothetical protein
MPTERLPLIGEEGAAWSEQRILTAVNLGFLDPEVNLKTFEIPGVKM